MSLKNVEFATLCHQNSNDIKLNFNDTAAKEILLWDLFLY